MFHIENKLHQICFPKILLKLLEPVCTTCSSALYWNSAKQMFRKLYNLGTLFLKCFFAKLLPLL